MSGRQDGREESAEVGEDDLGAREARSPQGLRRRKRKAGARGLGGGRGEGRACRVAPAVRHEVGGADHEVGGAGVTAFGDVPSLRGEGSAPCERIADRRCIALPAASPLEGVTAVRERHPGPCRSRGFEGATFGPSTCIAPLGGTGIVGRISSAARVSVQPERVRPRADSLQLSSSVVPISGASMSGASMRVLEWTMAVAAIITAVLIGLGH
jgi:hypothetical protein